uniref:50S ribosomal protein L10e n=1 Tax=Haloarcula marismortui TaxID=2238 RepID=A0A0X1KGB2_9EURY|nr:Chain H, Ribosomal Protein L10e [Haloarcula marismortui]1K73_J Chain J, RIBOSOMAL PROTEIN L10E [Haloarcula marismortui]1K8A_J Chain J, RIBOSOMAL PROTEIN L10E [Haloarcula marismortui]1K9M_J Chain J, RIBOSOMAL PROTEIN L10E [Haloarcula marismortui]1KC8_J Chain J, RIBOSOMAL PROTEIN L10E [Haloarcula marismortui]1KD1_J Chain J, RIBOSOMAL PROTEIN L10E [Haloarcula marismortui]1KQS_H Chain H, RIBOSOMAL PROTEIN L10E [Haloarcula marismortui]1M1K_J Chain J, Ribosomal Protein L10e [Haloarcula marismor
KPGAMYRNSSKPAYTRREYISGIPGKKIAQFDMGNNGAGPTYPAQVELVVEKPVQIRHNALEAARVAANRYVQNSGAAANYKFRIRKFPFHVIRENKAAAAAAAAAAADGMRAPFGKPVGTAARVHGANHIFIAWVNPDPNVEEAWRRAKMKVTPTINIDSSPAGNA